MSRIRPPTIHVVLLDGTFAALTEGRRSSIGRIHRLLAGQPSAMGRIRIHYGMGQQWNRWRTLPELAMGGILEARIIEAYGWLASGYVPGDRIFLLGYSRGAFAARSLAGMIGRVGLLRADAATERHLRLAWRYYQQGGTAQALGAFRRRRCHAQAPVRMLGCFDTAAVLGLPLPLLRKLTDPRFRFHDAHLGQGVEYGFQALALDETRTAFAPLLWDDGQGGHRIEQVWFRGAHADIGGQLAGFEAARPLANIPLVWMLERAEAVGLPLPPAWQRRFPCDATAPAIGNWRNWGKAFLARAPRVAGQHSTETLHPSVPLPYSGPALLVGALAPLGEGRSRWRRAPRVLPGDASAPARTGPETDPAEPA
jgi:uncharacterized protein (DUF2235 family)